MAIRHTLETERLLLRPIEASDFERIYAWSSDPENVRYMGWPPNTADSAKAFIAMAEPGRDFGIVLKSTGVLIGTGGINVKGHVAELGWILDKAYWKHGYGTEFGQAMVRYGFEDLGLHRLFAPCAAVNYGSYRVMENIGMRREGRMRKAYWSYVDRMWYDQLLYGMLEEDYFAKG